MIEIRDLKLNINNQDILSDINIQVADGEILGIIGKSGSGKSSLLKSIAGHYKDYSGNIRINNIPLASYTAKELREKMSGLLKKPSDNLIDDTVYNYLLLSRKPKKKFLNPYTEYDFQIAEEYLKLFQLEIYKDDKIFSISDGAFKRANLAYTFIVEAQIIQLDNPTSDLDIHSMLLLQKALQKYVIDGEKLAFIASNDLNFISQTVDRVIILDNGKIVAEGPPDIITADIIKKHFGIDVLISKNIYNGKPIIHLNLGA